MMMSFDFLLVQDVTDDVTDFMTKKSHKSHKLLSTCTVIATLKGLKPKFCGRNIN
jgi:hypothetical protein